MYLKQKKREREQGRGNRNRNSKCNKKTEKPNKKWIFRTCMLRMYLLCNVNAILKKKLNKKKTTTTTKTDI